MAKTASFKVDIIMKGFPVTAFVFPNDYGWVIKAFKAKFPAKKEEETAKTGPFDEAFQDAFDSLKASYDFQETIEEAYKIIDTIDISYATFKVPIIVDDVISFFSRKNPWNECEKKISCLDKTTTIKIDNFELSADEFSALLTKTQKRRSIYSWYSKIRGESFDNYQAGSVFSEDQIELLYIEYTETTIKFRDFKKLPVFLIDEMNKKLLTATNWESYKQDYEIEFNVLPGHQLGFLTFGDQVLTERRHSFKFDIKLAKKFSSSAEKKLTEAKKVWEQCKKDKYGTTYTKFDKNITWEKWLGSALRSDDPFYATGSKYYHNDVKTFKGKNRSFLREKFEIYISYEEAKDDWTKCRNTKYKTYGKYTESTSWKEWLDAQLETDDPFYTYKDNKYDEHDLKTFTGDNKEFLVDKLKIDFHDNELKKWFNYAAVEVIFKNDVSAKRREKINALYKHNEALITQIPLHPEWKDNDKKWQFPTMEERVLQAIKDF